MVNGIEQAQSRFFNEVLNIQVKVIDLELAPEADKNMEKNIRLYKRNIAFAIRNIANGLKDDK